MFAQVLNFIKSGGGISTDIFPLVAIFAVLFIYGLYFGKNRLISLILAYYPAVLLYKSFPFVDKLMVLHGEKLMVLNQLVIFLIFFVPLNIIVNSYTFAESSFTKANHTFRIAGLSLACLSLILLFSYTVVDLSVFYNFSTTLDKLFVGSTVLWGWNLAPLILLAFL